jgi:type II secretory pathway component GspD/PulD (secretin)
MTRNNYWRFGFLVVLVSFSLYGCGANTQRVSKRSFPKRADVYVVTDRLSATKTSSAEKVAGETKRLSMTFDRAPLEDVIRLLGAEFEVNMDVQVPLEGLVTISLHDTDLEQALDMVLRPQGYTYLLEPNRVIVLEPDTEVTKVFRLRYSKATALAPLLSTAFEPSYVKADTFANAIVVRTSASEISEVRRLIRQLDISQPGVLIKAEIYEISTDNTTRLGSQTSVLWNDANHQVDVQSPVSIDPTKVLARYSFTDALQFRSFIEALELRNEARLLSSPQVVTTSGVPAKILVGERVPYTRRSAETLSGSLVQQVEFVDVGIKLEVVPRVDEKSETIVIDVHPEVSEVLNKSVQGVPRIATREASTRVTVRNGQTVVIGGLIRENKKMSESKIPILGDLFLFGWLFKSKEKLRQQTELIVFITPYILTDVNRRLMREQRDDIQRRLFDSR